MTLRELAAEAAAYAALALALACSVSLLWLEPKPQEPVQNLPLLTHPLRCPIEDAKGRPLRFTRDDGIKQRCYYSGAGSKPNGRTK